MRQQKKIGIPAKQQRGWVNGQIASISDGKVFEILKELKSKQDENPNDRLLRLIGYVKRFVTQSITMNTKKKDTQLVPAK